MMEKKVTNIFRLEAKFSILYAIFLNIFRKLNNSGLDFEYSTKDRLFKKGLLPNINIPNKEFLEITSSENNEKLYFQILSILMKHLDRADLKSKVKQIHYLGYVDFDFKINDIVYFGDGGGRRIKEILFSRDGDKIYFINEISENEEKENEDTIQRIIVYEDALIESKVVNQESYNRLFSKKIKFSFIYDSVEKITKNQIKGNNEKKVFYKIHL